MRFSLLGSGSSGNVTWVETDRVRVLIDAGLSARETERRLALIGRSLEQVDAVLLTHEHEDHVRGLEVLSRSARFAVLGTRATLRSIRHGLAPGTELIEVQRLGATRIGDLVIETFPVPHDARDPVGFRLGSGDARLGYTTDLGTVNDCVRESLGGLTALIVESNHDVEMVRAGTYPPRLKKRILSPYGHLSNEATGELLREVDARSLRLLYLAHLSRSNNRPDLAAAVAALALAERDARPVLKLAAHDEPTPLEDAGGALPGTFLPLLARPEQLRFGFESTTGGRS